MKIPAISLLLLCAAIYLPAQSSKLYIHLVSHNEPSDNLQNALNYQRAKANLLTMADMVNSKNVKWNLQTSDGLVLGAQTDQQQNGSNIFATLAAAPYADNIEIDPRSKTNPGRNIADQWQQLYTLGANPSTTVGGFIYTVCNGNNALIDWWQYQDTITGLQYGNKVKFKLLSGAGSLPPHCNDLNDFGIFKPDTLNHFYAHNPSRGLWCVGTGCAPVLDSLADEQAIIDLIQGQADSIRLGLWPADKFYVTRIMTNQREYGPLFFSKLNKVLDALSLIPSDQLQWANISECFDAFQSWSAATENSHSMWACDQTAVATNDPATDQQVLVYPNPFDDVLNVEAGAFPDGAALLLFNTTGNLVWQSGINYGDRVQIPASELPPAVYLLQVSIGGRPVLYKILVKVG